MVKVKGANLIRVQYNQKTLFLEGFDPIKATGLLSPDYSIPTNFI
ncbi:hypothetical protein [Trichormus sp. NMC-1]|nr:hypothetical protein [Trichormus sp. NMC-1]